MEIYLLVALSAKVESSFKINDTESPEPTKTLPFWPIVMEANWNLVPDLSDINEREVAAKTAFNAKAIANKFIIAKL